MFQLKIAAAAILGAAVLGAPQQKAVDRESPLARLAATLKPGSWAVLNQDRDPSGWGLDFTDSGVGKGGALVFASKAAYDPIHRRVFFMASGHSHEPNSIERNDRVMKFIVYEVDQNKWTRLKNPQWYLDLGLNIINTHGYQLNTVGQGRFFRAHANTGHVYMCDVDKSRIEEIDHRKDWQALPPVPGTGQTARGFLEYFPDRGTLLFLDSSTGNLHEKSLSASNWTQLGNYRELGRDGVAAIYNPVHRTVVFGGGGGSSPNQRWWRIDAQGKISGIDDCPTDSYAHNRALFTVDPASGKHWLITQNHWQTPTGYLFHELDLTEKPGRQWKERKDLVPGIPNFHPFVQGLQTVSTLVVPLPEYGVNMVMGAATVWIYKHSAR